MKTMKNIPTVINPFGKGLTFSNEDLFCLFHQARKLKTSGCEHMVLQLQASSRYNDVVIVSESVAAKEYPENFTVCPMEFLDVYSYQMFAKSLQKALYCYRDRLANR